MIQAIALLCGLLLAPTPDEELAAKAALSEGRRLYEQGGDMKGAKEALTRAIELDDRLAEAFLYKGLVELESVNDPSNGDAEDDFRKALAIDPDYGEAWYDLGLLLRRQGKLDDAAAAFAKDAALRPASPAHHDLGEIYLQQGDDARAAVELERDLDVDFTCHDSRVNLAGLKLSHGDFAAARDQYETSLTMHPADARALSGLGRAYLALGDDELAVGSLRHALALDPEDDQSRRALASARWHLRLRYGWPFAAIPGILLVALAIMSNRRRRLP